MFMEIKAITLYDKVLEMLELLLIASLIRIIKTFLCIFWETKMLDKIKINYKKLSLFCRTLYVFV